MNFERLKEIFASGAPAILSLVGGVLFTGILAVYFNIGFWAVIPAGIGVLGFIYFLWKDYQPSSNKTTIVVTDEFSPLSELTDEEMDKIRKGFDEVMEDIKTLKSVTPDTNVEVTTSPKAKVTKTSSKKAKTPKKAATAKKTTKK